jgi:hypothetical protein
VYLVYQGKEVQGVKLADECWVALALLHQSWPERASFSAKEIIERLKSEHAHGELRPGVRPHIHQHLVANLPPESGRYRLFYRLPDGTFRLFRSGDDCHPRRTGKSKPAREDLPVDYRPLLDWYEKEYSPAASAEEADPIAQMWGLGKDVWEGVDAVEYQRRLRADSIGDYEAEKAASERPAPHGTRAERRRG